MTEVMTRIVTVKSFYWRHEVSSARAHLLILVCLNQNQICLLLPDINSVFSEGLKVSSQSWEL
jgi:hypothetical protein